MSNSDQSNQGEGEKRAGSTVWRLTKRYITPFPILVEQGRSTAGSLKRASESVVALAARKRSNQQGLDERAKAMAKMSPKERFDYLYKEMEWDEDSLRLQAGRIRVAKFALLTMGFCMIPAQLAVYFLMPSLMLSFLAPLLALFTILLFVKAARHAHWELQIEMRSLFSFKEFLSRDDFFKQLFV